jgi:hypothetical protein
MPMIVGPLGAVLAGCDTPDPSALAEDIVGELIDRAIKLEIDVGDAAALTALDLISRLAAYNRAELPVVLAAIGAAAPSRVAVLHAANQAGEPAPSLSLAKLAIARGACRLN